MEPKWLIIGVSGVTCGGKTTLSNECVKLLPNIRVLTQDEYFYPEDSGKHVLIPELNHFNWELITSLDMDQMYTDIKNIIKKNRLDSNVTELIKTQEINHMHEINEEDVNMIRMKQSEHKIQILLLEGFSIFNYAPIAELCHFKFYLTLTHDTCEKRRTKRSYNPPDVSGYFEKCVWPEYQKLLKEVEENVDDVVFLTETNTNKFASVFHCLIIYFKTLSS